MEKHVGAKVIEIYPKNYQEYYRKDLIAYIASAIVHLSILLLILFSDIQYSDMIDLIFLILIFTLAIGWNGLLVKAILILYYDPLIVFTDGFIRGETKFKSKLFRRSKFIDFNDVIEIKLLTDEPSIKKISFLLKNDKKIIQFLNGENEYQFIIKLYKKYHNKIL